MKSSILGVLVVFTVSLAACGGSNDSSSAPTLNSASLSSSGLIGTWSSNVDTLGINSDGTITSLGCGHEGALTSITPYATSSCPAGASTCGVGTLDITTSTGGGSCLGTGDHTCSFLTYTTSGVTYLTMNCGPGAYTYQKQ
jgi:hypothetical protein